MQGCLRQQLCIGRFSDGGRKNAWSGNVNERARRMQGLCIPSALDSKKSCCISGSLHLIILLLVRDSKCVHDARSFSRMEPVLWVGAVTRPGKGMLQGIGHRKRTFAVIVVEVEEPTSARPYSSANDSSKLRRILLTCTRSWLF